MKKIVTIALMFVLLLAGCASPSSSTEKIIVLTSPDYPPYEFIAEDGTLVGFDIELMEAIAAYLGVEVEWKEMNFEGIIAGLQAGQGDMAIAGMNVSEERLLAVDFSNIYKKGEALYTAVVLSSSGFSTIDDLAGKKIGVQTGTVQETALMVIMDKYGFTLESRTSFPTIIEDIKLGRLDALVIDSTNAVTYAQENPELTTFELIDPDLGGDTGTAIAFPKGSPWVAKVNEALAALEANGTIAALDAKWFTE
jgi:arginine/lysine/histidine transporter system substrate-binding protein